MKWAALIAWVLTAGGGFVMLAIWLSRGGMRQRGGGARMIRPPLILGHFALAATGLVLWIIYIATDSEALGWVALAALAVVALLGFTMFSIWYWQRQHTGVRSAAAAPVPGAAGTVADEMPAEQRFPVPVVALHGLLAVATVALVLLTDAGVGGS